MSDLDARLCTAHASGNTDALIALYSEAAEASLDATAVGFYLTHAYVFALEAGSARAEEFRMSLVAMGREPA